MFLEWLLKGWWKLDPNDRIRSADFLTGSSYKKIFSPFDGPTQLIEDKPLLRIHIKVAELAWSKHGFKILFSLEPKLDVYNGLFRAWILKGIRVHSGQYLRSIDFYSSKGLGHPTLGPGTRFVALRVRVVFFKK